jgi:hypothetical protein
VESGKVNVSSVACHYAVVNIAVVVAKEGTIAFADVVCGVSEVLEKEEAIVLVGLKNNVKRGQDSLRHGEFGWLVF